MATKKYRPQVNMLEIESLISSLTLTLETMQKNDIASIRNVTAPVKSGAQIKYIEIKKLLDKLSLFKYKSEIGLNAPAYTIKGDSKPISHPSTATAESITQDTERDIVESNPITSSNDIAQDIESSNMCEEERLYTKYVMNKELTLKEKIVALEYKMREDKESVTDEEREFYSKNFHLVLMGDL